LPGEKTKKGKREKKAQRAEQKVDIIEDAKRQGKREDPKAERISTK